MINTEQYQEVSQNIITGKELFFSLTNNRQFEYELEVELISMLLAEFDTTVDSYCQFEFTIVIDRKLKEAVKTSSGLILQSESKKLFIIFSQLLHDNKKLAQDLCEQLQMRESSPIKLSVVPPGGLGKDTFVKNIEFLYHHATISRNQEDFLKISNLLDLYSEARIGQLKRHISESSIYQLLFFHGLRANLESSLISDEMVVNASPLINSIIRSL